MFTALTQEIETARSGRRNLYRQIKELQKVRDNISQVILRLETQTNAMAEKITKEKPR
jgi:predicted  nucleic acid-binding Zn-ribbon protein